MSNPSMVTFGGGAPTSFITVGKRSTVAASYNNNNNVKYGTSHSLATCSTCRSFTGDNCHVTSFSQLLSVHKKLHGPVDILSTTFFRLWAKGAGTRLTVSYSNHKSTSVVIPGWIFPGQWAIPGTLCPPSHVVPLPHRRGPALPPLILLVSEGLQITWKKINLAHINFGHIHW